MKAKILCTVLLLATLACEDDDIFEKTPEVTEDMFNIELCPTLLPNVTGLFPEAKNNQDKYTELFADGSQQRIVLTKDTDVYVSFVAEAATMGNVLGYYIYNNGAVPGSSEDIDKQLIFPNVDNTFLTPGDSRRLGNAPLKAGTVIGFFLIVGGYKDDGVYYARPTFYTDQNWNNNQVKQHVLYQESECGAIIIGFEDRNTTEGDKDYNDIIFSVSDNKDNVANTSFDLQNVVSLSK